VRTIAIACAYLACCGCAQDPSLYWTHDENRRPALEADVAQCRDSARMDAQRQLVQPAPLMSGHSITLDPNRLYAVPSSPDRFYVERKLLQECMEGKGYRRVER
jgi:hypothetical protein